MSETKHTPAGYDSDGPVFALVDYACNSESYLNEAEKKLAEHPRLMAELSITRSINDDMLAALEAVAWEIDNPASRAYETLGEYKSSMIRAAIAKAKGGAK